MSKKYILVENRLKPGRKKKNFEDLSPSGKWNRLFYDKHPEEHEKYLKEQKERYAINKEKRSLQKKQLRIERTHSAIEVLGGKCDACEELYNPNLTRTNLQIHHRYYDKEELKKKERYGKIPTSTNTYDVLKMAKSGINPKKKYCLLCKECHNMVTFITQNQSKAWNILAWLVDNKVLDVDTIDTKENKTIEEFLS